MRWKLDKNRPICPQIGEQICVAIACGELKPKERLLSVREVAVTAGVNPNTVQKAFEQLEQTGLIYSVRSLGWFVAEDTSIAKETVNRLIREKTESYLAEMQLLGLNKQDTITYIKEYSV